MKITIPYFLHDQIELLIDGKEDDAIAVITTYISQEICFHTSGINYPHCIWKDMNSLFDNVDGSQDM